MCLYPAKQWGTPGSQPCSVTPETCPLKLYLVLWCLASLPQQIGRTGPEASVPKHPSLTLVSPFIFIYQELTTSWRKGQLCQKGSASLCVCIKSRVDLDGAGIGLVWEAGGTHTMLGISGLSACGSQLQKESNLESERPSVFCSSEVSC